MGFSARIFGAVMAGVFYFLAFNECRSAEIKLLPVDSGHVILVSGRIVQGDSQRFANTALATNDALVVLLSEGGALMESLNIGRAIRIKGFTTYVPDHAECASACALIWLAGVKHVMSSTARVGFHAAYIDESGVKAVTSSGNALVGSYLNTLGLPDKAILYLTAAAPDSVLWLTPTKATEMGISVAVYDTETAPNPSPQASSPPPPPRQPNSNNGYYQFWFGDDARSPGSPGVASLSQPAPLPPPSSAENEREAMSFVVRYLAVENDAAERSLRLMPAQYESQVLHYGKSKTRKEVAADYAQFVARWPVRKYALRPNSTVISCADDQPKCTIDAVIDWEVASAGRNAKSNGVSSWRLVLNKNEGRFTIAEIDGKVIERHVSELNSGGLCFGKFCLLGGATE
jgi:hypothetical protein